VPTSIASHVRNERAAGKKSDCDSRRAYRGHCACVRRAIDQLGKVGTGTPQALRDLARDEAPVTRADHPRRIRHRFTGQQRARRSLDFRDLTFGEVARHIDEGE
jgi:hypothetical protein